MPSRYPGAITQDWDPVVLHKPKPKAQALRDPRAVNQALRAGAAVETVKRFDAGTNRKASPATSARKLDEATEPAAVERVRAARGMSQAELAKLISERPQVVQDYESDKAVPAQAVLAKMEKVLGVKLRGTNIGK